jgi:hypothetical protein
MFLPLSLLLLPQVSVIKEQDWRALASNHAAEMVDMLYPKSIDHDASAKQRLHLVKNHPIYNFLHTYYRYPVSKVTAYSPGIGCA